jgi:nitroreductase
MPSLVKSLQTWVAIATARLIGRRVNATPNISLEGLFFITRAAREGILKNAAGGGDLFNFRRDVHMLEKVVANPSLKTARSDTLAHRIVRRLTEAGSYSGQDSKLIQWGIRVVFTYGQMHPAGHQMRDLAAIARALHLDLPSAKFGPVPASTRPPLKLTYGDFWALTLRRRSIRIFQRRFIPGADLRRAMAAALNSPSACNRQPFKFRYFDQQDTVQAIADAAQGVRGLYLPAIILITVQYRAYPDDREFLCPIVDAAQAAMTFQLALETLGAASLCINWPTDRLADQRLRSVVSLDADEAVIMRLAVGYADPAGMVACSPKRGMAGVFSVNADLSSEREERLT